MLRGDREAMRILTAAGACEGQLPKKPGSSEDLTKALRAVSKAVPMFFVPDMRATVAWYESLGFSVRDRHEERGELVFAEVSLGSASFTLSAGGGFLTTLLRRGDMDGRTGQALLLTHTPDLPCERVLLIGCGRERDFDDRAYRKAVATMVGVRLRGFPAWFAARTYHLALMPGLGRRMRLVTDWTVALFFGRAAAELGSLGHPPELGSLVEERPQEEQRR